MVFNKKVDGARFREGAQMYGVVSGFMVLISSVMDRNWDLCL